MKIAILGANGYIGRNLIKRLLEETTHTIIGLSPNVESLPITHERLIKRNVDVFDTPKLHEALEGVEAAYYLIHMMAQKRLDFAVAETQAAESFIAAARGTGLKRVIYLGGLGNDNTKLSKHLASRHHTGEILRSSIPLVIEFRASMVIGQGSISYDIVTNLVQKLPIITLPKWAKTLTQPIGLDDAITYLVAALSLDVQSHEIVEIGGPERLSYGSLMKRYAAWLRKPMLIVRLPIIPVTLAAWWLNLFTPRTHAKVGRIMVDSLSNRMVVTNQRATELFPRIHPQPLDEVFV